MTPVERIPDVTIVGTKDDAYLARALGREILLPRSVVMDAVLLSGDGIGDVWHEELVVGTRYDLVFVRESWWRQECRRG